MRSDVVRAATWNMGGGEQAGGPTPGEARTVLGALHRAGCSIILGQETQEAGDRDILRELGYRLHRTRPESLVAWLPELWTAVHVDDVTLNPTHPYYRKGGSSPVYVKSARVILCDRAGRSVDTLSYHTPSSVQPIDDAPPRRLAALRESMDTLAELADQTQARAVLFGGDDNVDENGPAWAFMLGDRTGLRQVKAPRATLGRRRVDDFRVRGFQVDSDGRVVHGPTHHNAHIRRFRWRA